ncbi:hypothetical protein CBR_g50816 [Chara braunii]|uniref:DDE Tnp4 domain-containing protein n=1 Tax=Chara braunii TaxID=69332 RepID=A0A388M7F0_CHABU|nr:hypothetical protein CBR_g50816 [Chara braunii]|eukprot:GBG90470.1 hypothetical protein CBR_g50816 [Chara braunii]
MDSHGCSNGLRDEEIDAVAMEVTVVIVNTMGDKESSSHDMLTWLRQRRALLQSVAEAPDCGATCEEGVKLCAAVTSGVFLRQTPRMATGLQAVRDVTSALLQAYPNAIKWPMGRRRAQILCAFCEKGFPNCFGAIDCTHIYMDKPAGAPFENYYDRKQKFSVQAHVVVDLDLRILDVHVGYLGSVHDVCVLHNSQLFRRAESGELFDATPENLPHGVVTRGYLLGDNGYPVACSWIVSPYGGIDQGADEERFDKRQKVARGCVEKAFSRLKCMWCLFLRTHKTNLETLPQQFVAVCTLHNILLDARIDFDENLLWEVDANNVQRRVDLGIVGNGARGRGRCTNVEGELLRDALQDGLALM